MQPTDEILYVTTTIIFDQLKKDRAPTSLGYNDFTVLFALAQEILGSKPITAEYISGYLNHHAAVPTDAKLDPAGVEQYLQRIERVGLIEKASERGFLMHTASVEIIRRSVADFKTASLEELAIRGISLYALKDSPAHK